MILFLPQGIGNGLCEWREEHDHLNTLFAQLFNKMQKSLYVPGIRMRCVSISILSCSDLPNLTEGTLFGRRHNTHIRINGWVL